MSQKIIFAVTHGDKETGSNPRMTEEGFRQIISLIPLLPTSPPCIICGVGERHLNVAQALGFFSRGLSELIEASSLAGDCDSLEIIDGKKMVVLANGYLVPLERHTSIADLRGATVCKVMTLQDQTVICTGRPFVLALGAPEAKSAAVYRITVEFNTVVDITEVVAYGSIETGLKQ